MLLNLRIEELAMMHLEALVRPFLVRSHQARSSQRPACGARIRKTWKAYDALEDEFSPRYDGKPGEGGHISDNEFGSGPAAN
jgi:hypothetical protein